VQVRYSAHARELTLAKGQVRFDVAHDVERPLRSPLPITRSLRPARRSTWTCLVRACWLP